MSEWDDNLKSGYYESPLGYNNVDWFLTEVSKKEITMAFYFEVTDKDIIMEKEDKEDYENNSVCRFC